MLSNSSNSNHVKCFKSRHSRVQFSTRQLSSLWIRQRIEWPRKITMSIAKRAKPTWRDLDCLVNQIFITSLNDRNEDKRGHAAVVVLYYESYPSCVDMNSTTVIYSCRRLLLSQRMCSEMAIAIVLQKMKTETSVHCFSYVWFEELKEWKRENFTSGWNLYFRFFKVREAISSKLENYF